MASCPGSAVCLAMGTHSELEKQAAVPVRGLLRDLDRLAQERLCRVDGILRESGLGEERHAQLASQPGSPGQRLRPGQGVPAFLGGGIDHLLC